MKREFKYLLFGLIFSCAAVGQNQVDKLEYWFNQDHQNKVAQNYTPALNYTFTDSLNVANLPNGVNMVTFRFKQNNDLWSSPATKIFLKIPQAALATQRNIVLYQYWLNRDFNSKVTTAVAPMATFIFIDSVNVSLLADGLNSISYRFKDDSGLWSPPATKFFIKQKDAQTITNKNVVAYQYWFNNNLQNVSTQNITATSLFFTTDSMVTAMLPLGVNTINYRFKDSEGMWSGIIKKVFVNKADPPQLQMPNLVAYRYWLGDDKANIHESEIANHTPNIYLIDTADLRLTTAGTYLFNMQFKDTSGLWSGTVTDTIVKNAYPYVAFTASKTTACSGEVITFSYDTADVDLLVWNYGTGVLDTTFAPSVSYATTGFYTVSVTAMNTDSNLANVFTKTNYIYADDGYDTVFYATICQGDSSFFDGAWYSADSVYSHNYQGAGACDSILSLDLTVLPNATSAISASICNGYSYIFGTQTLTTAGVYQETFPASNTCDSVVTLTLMINPVYNIADTATICRGETYLLGSQTLTQAGNYSETFSTASACDSVVNLTLLVNVVDTSVSVNQFTLTANANNASYQWLDCKIGYAVIPGANAKSYTPTVDGRYAVEVTQSNCKDTSSCHLISGIGIGEWNNENAIRVYPNPSDGNFTIEFKDPKQIEHIELFDDNMRQLAKFSVDSKTITIDLSLYADGIYFLKGVGLNSVRLVKR